MTMTKRLPSSEFEILEYEMYRMSWGEATVFIMQKVTECNDDVDEVSEEGDNDNNKAADDEPMSDIENEAQEVEDDN